MKDIDTSNIPVNNLTYDTTVLVSKVAVDNAKKEESSEVDDSKKLQSEKLDDTSSTQLKDNLDKINEIIPVSSTNLSFEFDEGGEPPFIRVIDKDSDEVIREIPSENFREVAKALDEFADKLASKGLLFNKTV